MPPRIVCVDDEPRILKGLRRRLGRDYDVTTAESGSEALALMREAEAFHVVISDMRMPGMSGAQFLSEARKEFPDTVRILLTGQSDLDDAIAAVNEGNIFRFLSKPCPPEVLMPALVDAVEHYQLIQAERELLEGTVKGSVTLLSEILSIKDPVASSRGARIKTHVRRLAAVMEIDSPWDLEVAAMLSQVGLAIVPGDIVKRVRRGEPLSAPEQHLYDSHPAVARDLLAHIPRLEVVAGVVGALGAEATHDLEPRIELGARVLTAALDYDDLMQAGMTEGAAVAALRQNGTKHGEDVLRALDRIAVEAGGYLEKELAVSELVSGVILAADLYASDGRLLLTEGCELSLAARARISQYAEHVGVREPVRVRVPI